MFNGSISDLEFYKPIRGPIEQHLSILKAKRKRDITKNIKSNYYGNALFRHISWKKYFV